MKILEEITRRSGGVKLREDNVLFMISTRLKDICVQYGVFIMTSTQLNGDWKDATIPDQNLLRGAKSIADRALCRLAQAQSSHSESHGKKNVNCWNAQKGNQQPTKRFNDYPVARSRA